MLSPAYSIRLAAWFSLHVTRIQFSLQAIIRKNRERYSTKYPQQKKVVVFF